MSRMTKYPDSPWVSRHSKLHLHAAPLGSLGVLVEPSESVMGSKLTTRRSPLLIFPVPFGIHDHFIGPKRVRVAKVVLSRSRLRVN